MKAKKILKSVFSFLLVLCIMCGLVGNYVPGGTVKAEGTVSSYTVTTTGAKGNFFLGNKIGATGTITLTYTVKETSLGKSTGNNGVVATHSPSADTPFSDGSMLYHPNTNMLMVSGSTYKLELSLDATTNYIKFKAWQDGERIYNLPYSPTTQKAGGEFFGIYFASKVKATLTNVTCVGEDGTDLELQSNQSDCVIQKEAESLMPTSYTVALNGHDSSSHFWMYNATANSGPITLSYTVEELSSDNIGRNGVVANQTTSPNKAWPCDYGSAYRTAKDASTNKHTNHFMKVGCTYTLTIGKDASGAVTFSGSYQDAAGTTHALTPISDWADWSQSGPIGPKNTSYKHFGVHMTSSVTGTLTNVTCVDASGKDLGITSNQSGSYAIKVTEEKNAMVQEFTATQFATHRTNKTYPTAPDGYVFAGWYSDKTCTTALKTNTIESTATAYAKYVDAEVLSVKYQLPADVSSSDTITTLRLVTTVDSLQYSFVGFQIYIGDKFIGAYKTKDVYDKITGTTDSTTVTYKPYVFSSESEYFMAVEIIGVPRDVFNQTITVIPAWETLDGTVVKANARQDIVIANAIATLEQ